MMQKIFLALVSTLLVAQTVSLNPGDTASIRCTGDELRITSQVINRIDVACITNTPTRTPTATVTPTVATMPSGNQIVLNPVADAYTQDGPQASTNFGASTILLAKTSTTTGYSRNTFLKFDLAGITSITNARLRVFGSNTTDNTAIAIRAYAVADTWTESGLTWNNQPTRGTQIATANINNVAQYYEFDVTAFAQSKAGGIASLELYSTATNEQRVDFNSRENVNSKPQLIVQTGNGTPPTNTPTVTPTRSVTQSPPTNTPTMTPTNTPTATPTSITPSAVAYPLKTSGRYLVDQNNVPFLMTGDAAWSLVAQVNNADADFYLTNRQAKGFNTVLVSLVEHKFSTNAPADVYGNAPFTGAPFITPNEAYFAHADAVIQSAAQHGIVVLLAPLYVGYGCGDEGWCVEIRNASVADMQSWGAYVGNRYKNFANIVWVVGADTDPVANGIGDKVTAFANALKTADPNHLITAHNARGQMATSPAWTDKAWLTLNNNYSTFANVAADAQTANTNGTPFFLIEAWYENEHSMTAQQLRAQSYWSILSGSNGAVFGNCPIWSLGFANSFCDSSASWKTSLDKPGSVHQTLVRGLFASRAWQNLAPDFAHAVLTAGYGSSTSYATTAASGSLVIAYLPTVRSVTVDMSKLTSATVTAKWYDPTNGNYLAIGTYVNTGTRTFTPTGNNAAGDSDWVLVIE